MKNFSFYSQLESKDCGPACLRMVSKHYGEEVSLQRLRDISETNRNGTNLHFLSQAAEELGYNSLVVKLSLAEIKKAPLPMILHWDQNHFVVLYGIQSKFGKTTYLIADPSVGLLKLDENVFKRHWGNSNGVNPEGVSLLIEKPIGFKTSNNSKDFGIASKTTVFSYMVQYKKYIWQLVIGLLIGSLLQALVPFLTQSIVDIGIRGQDLNFVYIILGAQIFLYLGRMAIQLTRNWILLHISVRVNVAMVSSFIRKLMRLPISFFDNKLTGDLLQRINDHRRIQNFVAVSSLDVIFSIVTILVLGGVLAYYSFQIFALFLVGSLCYCLWIILFLKRRKLIDNRQFKVQSQDNSKMLELINAMQDIKLYGIERAQRQSWEQIQAKLYKLNVSELKVTQYQDAGAGFLNEIKNLVIIVIAAKLVINSQITLGAMLAISYIVGQLNTPLNLLINFSRDFQDAQISFNRIAEIHNLDEEEIQLSKVNNELLELDDILLEDISFRYRGIKNWTIKNLSLTIPKNKVTAIVGHSGSGKTTLLKLLLRYYDTYKGTISLGETSLHHLSHRKWRSQCGVILQDSHIFNDTIRYNITLNNEHVDKESLKNAVRVSNMENFVYDLPAGLSTMIGKESMSLSSGQYQRILIARAVYKNPNYLFFDEATSALDTDNERIITNRLSNFFQNKTVVIIAHRLSTVINADQIIVLHDGAVVEKGTHYQLVTQRANYYNLIKDQLQLSK